MGKKSRLKREEKNSNIIGPSSKKILKELIRESKPEPFVVNGKLVYYNPLKKILEGEKYKSADGVAVTQDMVKQYQEFLKARFKQEKIAKENKVDIEKIDEEK